jgi:hypothetical protein
MPALQSDMKAARRLGSSLHLGRVPSSAVCAVHTCPRVLHQAAQQQAHFVSRLLPAATPSSHISSRRSSSSSSSSSSRHLLPGVQQSSELLLQHRHGVRCYSTPNLTPPSEPVQTISWLQDIQVWCPDPLGTGSSSSTSSSSSGSSSGYSPVGLDSSSDSNSSSSMNGSSGSSSSTAAAVYHPQRFQQLVEAQLRDPSSTFDAVIVLAGGLTADGGLPEWVHRRMDVARDLHLLQGRRPPIVCSGEVKSAAAVGRATGSAPVGPFMQVDAVLC